MKIIGIKGDERIYTCNAYLVLGTWKRIEDVNGLIDIGTNGSVMDSIEMISTGVGKRPVERVVLTHNHFDHSGGVMEVKRKYNPEIFACKKFDGVDEVLSDGQIIKLGDRDFEVIFTPGHSDDSICLYCAEEKVLFSGDTPLKIMTKEGGYSQEFISSLERIAQREIAIIYSGHDTPRTNNIHEMLHTTISNLKCNELSYRGRL